MGYDAGNPWPNWLADDQREASGRPDVVTFVSDTLTAPLKISGEPIANLVASTSGTDSDWVVKLIDVYPDEVGGDAVMGGYQLMIAADIFRGRYRESFAKARPIAANKPLGYRFALPMANHVFLPGHRIMVQIQSSWFPLCDRNPQTFVPNIFWAKPGDYRKATQRIYHSPENSSFIELPIAAPGEAKHGLCEGRPSVEPLNVTAIFSCPAPTLESVSPEPCRWLLRLGRRPTCAGSLPWDRERSNLAYWGSIWH